MIRLLNDDKVLSEITVRRIENKIYEIAKLLEINPAFFSQAKLIFECRLFNTKLWEDEFVIFLKSKNRVPWSSVISEYDNGVIEYNPKKFKNMTIAELVGNVVHETGHHFNFTHSYKWNKTRKYSTPYYVGYLFQFLAHYYDAFNDNQAEHLQSLLIDWREYINNKVH